MPYLLRQWYDLANAEGGHVVLPRRPFLLRHGNTEQIMNDEAELRELEQEIFGPQINEIAELKAEIAVLKAKIAELEAKQALSN
jgi:hypothetical protein